jgi:hypothetical protein
MIAHADFTTSMNDERQSSIQKLIKIKGINHNTAEALCANGILNYSDLIQFLSQHSAEEISRELKKRSGNLPQGFIRRESWIKQAKELRQLEKTSPAQSAESEKNANPPGERSNSQEPPVHHAEFSIFLDPLKDDDGNLVLRTLVYKAEDAGQEQAFFGSETFPWVNWIIEQANLPAEVAPIPQRVEISVEAKTHQDETADMDSNGKPFDARLEIGDFLVSVLEPSIEKPEKGLGAELKFRLTGKNADSLASQKFPYSIEVYTLNLDGGMPERVAFEGGFLEPDQLEYIRQLEFSIPEVGRYEHHAIARILPYGDLVATHWGPTMRVK